MCRKIIVGTLVACKIARQVCKLVSITSNKDSFKEDFYDLGIVFYDLGT